MIHTTPDGPPLPSWYPTLENCTHRIGSNRTASVNTAYHRITAYTTSGVYNFLMLDIKTEGEERPELYVSKRYYFFINHSLFTWGDFFSYYCLICFAINSFIKFIIILLTYMLKFSLFIFGSFQLFKVITFYSDPYWSYNQK